MTAKRTAGRLRRDGMQVGPTGPTYYLVCGKDGANSTIFVSALPQTQKDARFIDEAVERLVACWNAFEPGGAVALAREALKEIDDETILQSDQDEVPPSIARIQALARRALAALGEVKP